MKRVLLLIVIIILLAGCGSKENQARDTVEDYMEATKNGEVYNNISYDADSFYDVFDYEYLQTLEENEIKDTISIDYEEWEYMYGDDEEPLYATFEDYKEYYKEDIINDYEIIYEDSETLEYWDEESYEYEYVLLYNVEIANSAGEKIYKKAEFTLNEGLVRNEADTDFVEGYDITDIYLR